VADSDVLSREELEHAAWVDRLAATPAVAGEDLADVQGEEPAEVQVWETDGGATGGVAAPAVVAPGGRYARLLDPGRPVTAVAPAVPVAETVDELAPPVVVAMPQASPPAAGFPSPVDGWVRGGAVRAHFTWGRVFSYIGLLVAVGLSMAANVEAVMEPPAEAPADWHPSEVLVAGALFPPGLLAIGFEVLMRARWVGRYKYGRMAMAVVVLLPAMVSFQHMSNLLGELGENQSVATLFPIAIDALGVMCAFALMSEKAADEEAGPLRRGSFPPPVAGPFPPALDGSYGARDERELATNGSRH
jgi:hypothetical protein